MPTKPSGEVTQIILDRLQRVEDETAQQNVKLTELYTLYLKARGAKWTIVTIASVLGSILTLVLMAVGIFVTGGGY